MILWLNFMYGRALGLLTIPIALMMHFTNKALLYLCFIIYQYFLIKIALWVYIMTRRVNRILIKSPCKYILHTYKGKYNL